MHIFLFLIITLIPDITQKIIIYSCNIPISSGVCVGNGETQKAFKV